MTAHFHHFHQQPSINRYPTSKTHQGPTDPHWFYPSHTPKVKDSLLADASAALDRLEEILGGDRPPEAPEAVAVEVVPKGSPGFNLERETHDSQERGDPWGFPYGSMKIRFMWLRP